MTLREWRRKAKMSQIELAAKIGVHQVTVSRWETGVERPAFDTAAALEKMTGGKVKMGSWVRGAA
jgi:transcriptional regulator with XRE-family HTH domain